MRHVILHYHLFKNAGTSVDHLLRSNFSEAWTEREFPDDSLDIPAQVSEWIASEPDKLAFSSHTAIGPLPSIPDTTITPILFIRHPIDRLRSAYTFERDQQSESYGSVIARETSFAGYVRIRLATPGERFVRNFHAHRLASFSDLTNVDERTCAFDGLEALHTVGVVDAFGQSMTCIAARMKESFPDFEVGHVHENASANNADGLDQRLARIRSELGDETWEKLVEANETDLALYNCARERVSSVRARIE